ncbi:membrane or secreted protein [Roseivirga sp.]|uniref:membrane or secreted protein n=1 Tax=Roseivirga sp. TaxID=1964215 RepID=UPI003B8AA9B1
MKALSYLLSFALLFVGSNKESDVNLANALEGAWEIEKIDGKSLGHRAVFLLESPYAFYSEFDVDSKKFVGSRGGAIEIMGNKASYTVEFDTWDKENVGTAYEITATLNSNRVTLDFSSSEDSFQMVLVRIDNGQGDLAGSWRITDRMRNGEMQAMRLGARKTIKMITGSRFQWVAFNPESKQFSGTGGGTVILKDGKYNEHIEYFSKNPDRVGADLSFDYKVNGDKWDHSGKSSTGNPIREIWTKQ